MIGLGLDARSTRRPKRWPRELDEPLRTLVARGTPLKIIARKLDRSPGTIAGRMAVLGLSIYEARRQLWRNEQARRAEQMDPIAAAIVWLVSTGHEFEWVYPDHIDVDGDVVPVGDAVRLARNAGAIIPPPPPEQEQ